MRDDIDKLPLPKSAKKYARMTSKDLGSDWSKKVDMYMDMAADLTNQSKEGFKNKDASGKVKHAFKESADQIVDRLLEDDSLLRSLGKVAAKPFKRVEKALQAFIDAWEDEDIDPRLSFEHSVTAALNTLGVDTSSSEIAEEIAHNLHRLENLNYGVESAEEDILGAVDHHIPDASSDIKWAIRKVFMSAAAHIKAGYDEMGYDPDDGMPESLGEGIKAAAVKCHDGTVIAGPRGADHIAPCMMANQQGKSWDDEGLGFVTDEDRFVTRDEAEMIGMAHGQLKPEISDPGMVHAKDFNWNESFDRGYHYETCCVSADGGDISDMVDQAQDVSYAQFMRNVSISEIFQSGIGYGYYWTPAQAVVAGVDYQEVARNRPLTLKKDWHVSYHRSTYQGKPCYFMVHSAIEYVFVKD